MKYHVFLYKSKYDNSWLKNHLKKGFTDSFNIRYAADALEPFDTEPVIKHLSDSLGEKAKVIVKYPPKEHNQAPYLLIATSYAVAETIIAGILSAACIFGLRFYDAETDKSFSLNPYIQTSMIHGKWRSQQLCSSIRAQMEGKSIWKLHHVRTLFDRGTKYYYVITICKPKDGDVISIVKQFDSILLSSINSDEQLIHTSNCFTISGSGYDIVFYLEGYGKHAHQCWYIRKGEIESRLIHRMPYEQMHNWLKNAKVLDREDALYRLGHTEMICEYPDVLDRLAASIKLAKKLLKLPCRVAIGPVVHPCDADLCFHIYSEDLNDMDDVSMFRMVGYDDGRRFLQFVDDIMPFIRDRLYDETHYPIKVLEAVGNRLKEIKGIIIQNPFSEELRPYCESKDFTPYTPEEINEDKDSFIALFDTFTKWIDLQLEHYDDDEMFVVIGP